ncbi:glycosyltransferase [Spirosoma flavum]|uniref:Glycosyltransferase n=1 Tax=Spirosoma flavum TaxID=2048557 RepID=A0ABW6ABJ2_9BACT
MKILYLTFYFEPDIGPGAFRNTSLVHELSRQLSSDSEIHVVTTQPNRYKSYKPIAPEYEEQRYGGCSVIIERIKIPTHASGLLDQIRSFAAYYWVAHRLTKKVNYDLVVASSSRLFTAFLGAKLAWRGLSRRGLTRDQHIPLFLDIRDLFREVILEMVKMPFVGVLLNPLLWAVEQYTFGHATHINLVSEGFRSYFKSFPQATYSYFTNGIDDTFLTIPSRPEAPDPHVQTLLYAGNIGEGQSLHKIIPQAARLLGDGYRFVVIGNGGAKGKLEAAIRVEEVMNVEVRQPVSPTELIEYYQKADYLFVHLNNLDACKRVLPSKLFECGAMDKPIVAGVAGHAASFVREYIPNHILFSPGDATDLVRQLREKPYYTQVRTDFRAQFQRKNISQAMARQILRTLAETTVDKVNTLNTVAV